MRVERVNMRKSLSTGPGSNQSVSAVVVIGTFYCSYGIKQLVDMESLAQGTPSNIINLPSPHSMILKEHLPFSETIQPMLFTELLKSPASSWPLK